MAVRRKRHGKYDDRAGWVVTESACVTCESCTRGQLGPRQSSWDASMVMGETDCPDHCDSCGVLLPTALTADGCEYVREAIRNYTGDPKILKLWLEHFKYAFDGEPEYYGATIRAFERCSERIKKAFPGIPRSPETYVMWDADYGLMVASTSLWFLKNLYESVGDGQFSEVGHHGVGEVAIVKPVAMVMLPWKDALVK